MRKVCLKCRKRKREGQFGFTRDGNLYARCIVCRGLDKKAKLYTPTEIIEMLCFHLDTKYSDLVTEDTTRLVTLKRHMLMFFLFRYTTLTLKEVASLFNRSDHSTVLNAIKKIDGYRKSYPVFFKAMRNIRVKLKAQNRKYFMKKSNVEPSSTFSFGESQNDDS